MRVVFDYAAEESLGKYYEGYRNLPTGGTDLEQRSNNYRTIVRTLSNINQYVNQTYKKNGKNYIEIKGIGVIEYKIIQAKGVLIVKNIYFNDSQTQTQNTNQQNNTNQVQQNTQQQNNQQQPQIKYKRVSKESFGLTKVQSNNKLFNFVDKNGKFFYPHSWFKQAEDFKQWNKYVAARVFNGKQWYFLRLDNKLLYPTAGKTESRLLKKRLLERELQEVIDDIERFLIERNKRYSSKKNISPSLLKEHRLFEERFNDYKEKRQLKRIIRQLL